MTESPSMSEHFSMLHPHFTPDINLGHLVNKQIGKHRNPRVIQVLGPDLGG